MLRPIVFEPPLIRAWRQYEQECLLLCHFRQQLRPVVSSCRLRHTSPPGNHLRKPSHRISNYHYINIVIDTNNESIHDIIDKLSLEYLLVKQQLTDSVNNTACHHIANHPINRSALFTADCISNERRRIQSHTQGIHPSRAHHRRSRRRHQRRLPNSTRHLLHPASKPTSILEAFSFAPPTLFVV
jgi:hypothetical protein